MHRIMVVGGHSGDEAVMAGAIICKYTSRGHKAHIVSMTHGDGGHPTLSRAEYRPQKEAESKRAAEVLGASTFVCPASADGRLEVSLNMQQVLAGQIREHCPDLIITHWKGSFHRDHVASYYNVQYAMRLAADEEHKSSLPPFKVKECLYAENWEDLDGYNADIYVEMSQAEQDAWQKACESFEFFRVGFYNFNYCRFYKALHMVRGQLSRKNLPLACTLMRRPAPPMQVGDSLPGMPL